MKPNRTTETSGATCSRCSDPAAGGGSGSPGPGTGLANVGMSGVWGVRPAWPLVMSCPALTGKVDMGGAAGGLDIIGTDGEGEAKVGTAEELDGGKGGRLVKGASVAGGGNWEGVPIWLRKPEGGGTVGRLGDIEELWTGTELDPWRDIGLETPERHMFCLEVSNTGPREHSPSSQAGLRAQ